MAKKKAAKRAPALVTQTGIQLGEQAEQLPDEIGTGTPAYESEDLDSHRIVLMAKKRAAKRAPAKTGLRDRIVEMRRVRAGDLQPNPENWRTHGEEQLAALSGILGEVGIADAVLAFPADGLGPDGDFSKLMLFDGHARIERDPDQLWPVIVTDLTLDEARLMLATTDPLAAMAGTDQAKLTSLVQAAEMESHGLADMLVELVTQTGIQLGEFAEGQTAAGIWDEAGGHEFDNPEVETHRLVMHFPTPEDRVKFFTILGIEGTPKTKCAWFPKAPIAE
jgi:hypothetical protein